VGKITLGWKRQTLVPKIGGLCRLSAASFIDLPGGISILSQLTFAYRDIAARPKYAS
jgi:hypothetical protein